MTTKYTPAPWNTPWSDDEPHRYVLGRGDMLIADCYADTAEDFGLPDPEEYQANAKLIAAAPELLSGLVSILEILRSGKPVDAINDAHWIEMLIEKATGEQP